MRSRAHESTHSEEVAALLAPRSPLGLPIPAYGGRSLPNVARSALDALGIRLEGAPELSPPLELTVDPFRGGTAEGPILLFLVDGLGWFSFDRWCRSAEEGVATQWRDHARPITTVFPTTTTAALTSLSTAVPPGRHGVVGYRQYLPAFGVVADLLKMTPVGVGTADTLVGPEWSPNLVATAPTIFHRGAAAEVVSREEFQGSGFTRLIYDGARYVPYATASDLAHQLVALLGRPEPPKLVYAYWDELDTVHHLRGPEGELFEFEAERLLHLIDFVARHLEPERSRATTVLLTADHGQVPADPAQQIRLDREPAIESEMARPLAGDRRAGYFTAIPGRTEALRAALEHRLPPGSRVVPVADAIGAGLFGPPPLTPDLAWRIGELLAFVPPGSGLTQLLAGRTSPKRELLGAHGGIAPEELIVPLIAGPLAELVPERARPGPSGTPRGQR
jgi:type I phosphodiesterase/nucleotide pyrophosphatase